MANATFGAVTDRDRYRGRMLRTSLRVGDPKFDNGNAQIGMPFGGVGAATLSIEDDLASLRRDLWLRTDEAYKFALQMLAMKKAAATSQVQDETDAVPDFSEQAAAQTVVAVPGPAPDPNQLAELASKVSAVLRDFPGIATSRVSAMHLQTRRRLLTSEGSWADQPSSLVRIEVAASTQADDGMELDDYVSFSGNAPAELPAFDAMQSAVRAMAERLQARRSAVRPDNGMATVLFEGDAAAQLVKQLFGDQLVGTPPPRTMGRGARGAASELLGRIGQQVTAPSLSAFDDPTLQKGPGGELLLGSYRADDEGVPAQRVQLLEDGVLRALLMSRVPSKDIPRSNGHARAGGFGEPRARVANLVVSAKGGLGRAAFLAKASKLAKQKGGPLYVVRLLDDPTTLGTLASSGPSMMRAFMGGRGGGAPPQQPLVAFRIDGGKEVPVRGFTLEGLTPKSLKDLVAASKDQVVLNYLDAFAGGLPCTVVSPALLFADLEVRKQSSKDERPPLYPHPYFAPAQAVAP
jgi:predicted Zn-dependent protease